MPIYTKCLRCRRALSNPKYQQIGYGSVCMRKMGILDTTRTESENLKGVIRDPDTVLTEFHGDVILHRDGATKYMNVPQVKALHSPTGLEWGYAGSGPADMALNILLLYGCDNDFATRWHQTFKFEFIANMPRSGGIISGERIRQWIAQHSQPDTTEQSNF